MARGSYKSYSHRPALKRGFSVDFEGIYETVREAVEKVVGDDIERAYEIALEKVPVRKVFKGGRKTTRLLSTQELVQSQVALNRIMTPSDRAKLFENGFTRVNGVKVANSLSRKTVSHRNSMTKWGIGRFDPEQKDVPTNKPRHLNGRQGRYLGTQSLRRLRMVSYHETENGKTAPSRAGYPGENMTGKGAQYKLDKKDKAIQQNGTGYLTWGANRQSVRAASKNARVLEGMLNAEGRRSLRGAMITFDDKGRASDTGYGAISANSDGTYDLGGTLRKSIKKTYRFSSKYIEHRVEAGGGKASYAKYMEFGTRFVASRPFMRPALATAERGFKPRMHSAIRRALATIATVSE